MMRRFEYAIVGGGAAGATAAESIRGGDATGSLAVFTKEWAPPYQRPPLSKEFLQGRARLEDALMFPATWYIQHGIDLFVGVSVLQIDTARKRLLTEAGDIEYGRLLLATGAQGVVMIGSGFIGMEVAASLRSGGCEVTVVTIDPALYARFGREVSEYAKSLFERHGIRTLLQTSIAAITGKDRVEGVTLKDGERIGANAVVIGIGASPETALAQTAGIRVEDGIVVDDRLCTSVADVYAAGDVARFPGIDGHLTRVEHFDNAYSSGAAAGANMAGADQSYRYVPFFWSDVFELNFEFVGDPTDDSKIVQGTLESGSFVVEYRDGERLRGALLARRTPEERDAYRHRLDSAAIST